MTLCLSLGQQTGFAMGHDKVRSEGSRDSVKTFGDDTKFLERNNVKFNKPRKHYNYFSLKKKLQIIYSTDATCRVHCCKDLTQSWVSVIQNCLLSLIPQQPVPPGISCWHQQVVSVASRTLPATNPGEFAASIYLHMKDRNMNSTVEYQYTFNVNSFCRYINFHHKQKRKKCSLVIVT